MPTMNGFSVLYCLAAGAAAFSLWSCDVDITRKARAAREAADATLRSR